MNLEKQLVFIFLLGNAWLMRAEIYPVPLWSGKKIPPAAEIPVLKNVQFSVIKRYEPEKDGYRWLHGVSLCWHHGNLYASYGTNRGKENTPTEETHIRMSQDGGHTWGPSQVVARETNAPVGISHGSMISHEGTLWVFSGAFTNNFQFTHTRAYTLDEKRGGWIDHGAVVGNGFWPLQEPRYLPTGNWVMGGLRASAGWNFSDGPRPAVAVSNGDDFLHWKLIPMTKGEIPGGIWGESTADVWGPFVTLTVRPGWTEIPTVAHVATSADGGKTWTELKATNLPLATSKPYTGILSNGIRYIISQTTADQGGKRSPLTIAWSTPGEWSYSHLAIIRRSLFPEGPGESHPNAALSYPYAVEHEGYLYVAYSNNGPGRSNNNSAELAIIPIQTLCEMGTSVKEEGNFATARASEDTFIFDSGHWSNCSWGKWQTPLLCIGLNNDTNRYRALLRFPLEGVLRPCDQIERAEIALTVVSREKIGKGVFDLRLHLLSDSNAGWREEDGSESVKRGSPCWNWLAYNTTSWAGEQGIGNSEASQGIAKTVGSISINPEKIEIGDRLVFTITDPAVLQKIRSWISGGKNAGFLLTTDEASGRQNALQIASREHQSEMYRPSISLWAAVRP